MTSEVLPNTVLTEAEKQGMFVHGNDQISRLRNVSANPRVFILSGPSGVGKDSVILKLKDAMPEARFVVTSTSRPIRPREEEDGVHYDFMERTELERRIDAGEYIEHSDVYQKHLYGVPRKPILDGLANGQHVIIKVDVVGTEKLRKKISPLTSIFLTAESMEELYCRLKARNTENPEALTRRFRTACHELDKAREFDYVVFNEAGNLPETVADLRRVIDTEVKRINHREVWVSSQ